MGRPAAVAFTDGRVIGAKLDRNGLRPGRYFTTADGLVVMASEAGVLPVKPEEDVRMKGRLAPGRMLLVDTEQKRLISDEEVKRQLSARQPYGEWVRENQITLDHLPIPQHVHPTNHETILMRQRAFGYTDEDLKTILLPAAKGAEEPVGLDGHRHAAGVPVGQAAGAFQLFQADVRPGHQPRDRFDSRGAGDVAQHLYRV